MCPKAESPGANPSKHFPGKGILRDRVPLPGQSLVTESATTQEHYKATAHQMQVWPKTMLPMYPLLRSC